MKKIIVATALTIVSLQGYLYAQENILPPQKTKTERTFNLNPSFINQRHTAWLHNNEKMVIELVDVNDYSLLGNIDSILQIVNKDIAFYKDSIAETENVRIDYSFNAGNTTDVPGHTNDYTQMRITKHNPQGSLYIKRHDELSSLKIEQDTVRILLHKPLQKNTSKMYFYDYPVQITFYLNDYKNLGGIVQDKVLQNIVDTLAVTAMSHRHKNQNVSRNRSTIFYQPFVAAPNKHIYKFNYVSLDNSYAIVRDQLTMNTYIGVALVRNMLSPTASLGINFSHLQKHDNSTSYIYGVYAQPYFLFDKKADGSYATLTNWFLNAEFGASSQSSSKFLRGTMGVGYLLKPDGYNFKNTTMKAFLNYTFKNGINLSPEVIFTDNFHNVFPGFTMSYYLNSFLD